MRAAIAGLVLVPTSAWVPTAATLKRARSPPSVSLPVSHAVALGIDVGTGSARCGVFSLDGDLLGTASKEIKMFQPKGMPELWQQSSENIWQSVCEATREAIKASGVPASEVAGVGFDATCSLVCLAEDGATPVSVDPVTGEPERNIVVWLDHRAKAQADRINAGGHEALRTVGGTISLEMEVPKLLWLKEEMADKWLGGAAPEKERFGKFFDLSDWLVYRATGTDTRSLCTTVCKWNYDALGDPEGGSPPKGWDADFLASIGLSELLEAKGSPIGESVAEPGQPVGAGLAAEAAADLGLAVGTPVGVGMIDAHAGGLGVLGALVTDPYADEAAGEAAGEAVVSADQMEGRMALIAGTSCCHMLSSKEPVFVPGVWGPYKSAMLPGMFLNEGGQSTAGKLLDFVVQTHAAYQEVLKLAEAAGKPARGGPPFAYLNEHLLAMARARGLDERKVGFLAKDLHVGPDFFGNRSPLADPSMRGSVVGLGLSSGPDDLALLYLATLQALAYQTKHIIETCELAGHPPIETIFVTGGLVKNPLYLEAHADVANCVLEVPKCDEAVLLGAAVLGARAGGAFGDVASAMASMNKPGKRVLPFTLECGDACDISVPSFHGCKYGVFRKMIDDQVSYRELMEMAMLD
eukprot:CAMPEP_0172618292 /NCGR_PEP_ID=MMETSP1068-20121228/78860_1 /TAXON_ID=35684 /ORGANISM="Pseudopedinella elastica, Strain CCMP716" /LENGTH=636 /DNA_ID=CAMNT_0013424427 /DNA_START=108 /DNA_END=2018 /DNA_ORIENTATION=+